MLCFKSYLVIEHNLFSQLSKQECVTLDQPESPSRMIREDNLAPVEASSYVNAVDANILPDLPITKSVLFQA